MPKTNPESVPLWAVVLIACILLIQSLFLFIHSRRHTKYYWIWGIVGLIQFPGPLVAYWLVHIYWPLRKERLKNRKHQNGSNE
ncbi:transcriptional regulator [Paenibacillus sp. FSL W8-0194]|uniref:transcriptional regulator n=1 Tax=Paenibacillus sp. FSL W8-0194 TaxID=2921711 RepID=UPI0030DA8B5A